MNEAPQTNQIVILCVVVTLAANATIGMATLAYCIVEKIDITPVLLTPFIGIVTYVFGVVSGMLVKTSPTEATKQPANDPTAPKGGGPAPVEVVNTPDAPVPTVEAPKENLVTPPEV